MTLLELQEKRNKLMHDATAIMQGDKAVEQRSAFDQMMQQVDELDADIARHKRVEAFAAEQRTNRPPRGVPGRSMDNGENAELEKRAFRKFMVTGDQTELRDLGVGTVGGSITGGNQLVAPAFYPVLTQAQKFYGGVVNIVNQKKTDTGASMQFASSNDATAGIQPWAESTPAPEADPSLAKNYSATETYTTGVISVTLEELEDSAWDIDKFVQDIFGQRLYRGLAKYVSQGSTASGSAVGAYVSYLSGAVNGATSAAKGVIAYQDLLNLWASVDKEYADRGTFVMNTTTRAALMGVVDQIGRPLFQPSTTSGPFDTLLGRPIVLDNFLPNIAANSTSLVFGDFESLYTLRSVGDFTVYRDPYTYLTTKGSVAFVGAGRGGSFITDAGTHPVKYLTQAAS
ncbi:phage major capsid protein [Terriglobus aquaticus]|uniref:Phage major capsid protein n=1 Tax=Terriglobus aquaticus TaxID=940139 RepID=A0ABW9KKR7_9BACT|nr:phage major capsid protein [Terriglobus aquaticus]